MIDDSMVGDEKKRPGRPPTVEGGFEATVHIPVSQELKEQWTEIATRANISLAEYLRRFLPKLGDLDNIDQ